MYPEVPVPFLLKRGLASIHTPGRHLIFVKDPHDLTVGYRPIDIQFQVIGCPPLAPAMREVWTNRYEMKFSQGVRRNGTLIGTQGPKQTDGRLRLPIFQTNFLDWQLTLPWGDKFDSVLDTSSLRPPLDMHCVPITQDGNLLYVERETQRMTWPNSILCFHSFGYDKDLDGTQEIVLKEMGEDHGYAIFKQAQLGVLREFNPFEATLLKPHQVRIRNMSCLTLHARPVDYGWHFCFVAEVAGDSKELLEKRAAYPCLGRISSYHRWPFSEADMVEFFWKYADTVATTIEPAIIMACVQSFGPEFLKALPYNCHILNDQTEAAP